MGARHNIAMQHNGPMTKTSLTAVPPVSAPRGSAYTDEMLSPGLA
jgi:hypothetical protein